MDATALPCAQPTDLLELRRAGDLAPLEHRRFRGGQRGAGGIHPSKRRATVDLEPRPHGVDRHEYPPAVGQQIERRLGNAYVGLDAADENFVDVPAPADRRRDRTAAGAERETSTAAAQAVRPTRRTVGPSPFGYCSVATIGSPSILAASTSRRTFQTTRGPSAIAGMSFSCTSMTASAVSPRDINSGLRGRQVCSLIGDSIADDRPQGNGRNRWGLIGGRILPWCNRGFSAILTVETFGKSLKVNTAMKTHSTTILTVRHRGVVALGGDGQVTVGETIMKADVNKLRRLMDGKVMTGFAGSTADAFALLERFEAKLKDYPSNVPARPPSWPRNGAPIASCGGWKPCW